MEKPVMGDTVLEESFRRAGGKRTYVQRLFARIARVYDLLNRLMSLGLDRRWRAFAARCLALGPGEIGLDLGAGTADLAIAVIRQAGPGARMIGMDITPEMLDLGRRKLVRLGLQDRIELRVGDAEHIDLPDNSVDGCCSAFMMRNVTDLRQALREMLRVVRPGGRMVCLEISHPPGKLLGALFHLYFYRIAPLFGAIIGKAAEEYRYLPRSLTHFPDAPALKAIMEEVGWSEVRFHRLNGGIVAVHVATKPGPGSKSGTSADEADQPLA
ncbi:ubiquinone/menaquinone biosynthesis C-methyltransferase UbiE [Thermogemmatispora aurantia]|jgi:demethylmenaquinone methyltransferase/2-methoxy-6-polyprenyl-1,4-benzoquinol methylase|uniref:Demethylmenaquinone methyltransferase n=1 Tax=Thermogemmatispora aurantia TaxID=2045279 RepID=A0A5J4KFU5_9CHLR|nr:MULTISPECIES: class I SAM-dependent methyltransferase [Thermogemmatispora]GER85191.1 ubiquinone/menaquinone biosynthesis C-methyltransferase UbiE [Thermogemmatispora aurantia]